MDLGISSVILIGERGGFLKKKKKRAKPRKKTDQDKLGCMCQWLLEEGNGGEEAMTELKRERLKRGGEIYVGFDRMIIGSVNCIQFLF